MRISFHLNHTLFAASDLIEGWTSILEMSLWHAKKKEMYTDNGGTARGGPNLLLFGWDALRTLYLVRASSRSS
jgi:hypothetical protein